MADLEVRLLAPDDVPGAVSLKNAVFGPRRADEKLWRHLYLETPWPPAPSVVAVRDSRVVGVLASLTRPLQLGEHRGFSVQACDLMVAKEERGRATQVRLGDLLASTLREAGVSLYYSFPNVRATRRMFDPNRPWIMGFEVPVYARILRPGLALKAGRETGGRQRMAVALALRAAALAPALPPSGQAPEMRLSSELPGDVDGLWERASVLARFQTVRDGRYLAWRYQENPAATYEFITARSGGRLTGLMVLSQQEVKGAQGLFVADWAVERVDGVFGHLLRQAVRIARSRPDVAMVGLSTLPPYHREALKAGFWRVPAAVSPTRQFFHAANAQALPVPLAEVLDPRNWFMTMGDSDVI